ncbi:MAG TPA: redoxin domain-containing protein [Pirellulales bacterium]|jgi:mono/diheme cytochrome c family protein/peroxiredoxin|nr:redoxin domain-containing protein [Pirellulales bacterium]
MSSQTPSAAEPGAERHARPVRPWQALLIAALGAAALGLSAAGGWYLRSASGRSANLEVGAEPPALSAGPLHDGQASRGKLVYQVYCNRCHGPEGRGDGPSAAELKPPPRDLHARPLKHGAAPAQLRKVIVEGVPGTAMPSAGQALSPSDVEALVAFVQTLVAQDNADAELAPQTRSLVEQAGFVPADALREAPALDLRDAEGQAVSLARLRGKLVLLNFWGAACSSCIVELPEIERLADDLRERGLEVLCPCADEHDAATVAAVARQRVSRLPVFTDPAGATCLRYDVQLTPTACLIDPTGRLIGRSQGAHQWSAAGIGALLEHYAAQAAVR